MAGHQKPEISSSLQSLPGNPREHTIHIADPGTRRRNPLLSNSAKSAEGRPRAAKGFALTWWGPLKAFFSAEALVWL